MQNSDTDVKREEPSLAYAWYMVALCMVAYIFSFIDRQIITLLVDPIRSDLQISDTQFSLLTGLAFALFYATMGIPIARLADSRSRPLIIAVGIFIWSIATAVCGLTRSFWQLFMARMAVGVGEAALSPAAYSMIADSFPRKQLGTALGVYSMGIPIGSGLAILIGGTLIGYITGLGIIDLPLLGTVKPWQLTFFIVGLPGVLIAALFIITIRDPERKGATHPGGFAIREIVAYMVQHRRIFISHYVGFGFAALTMFSLIFWAPAYLGRNFGLAPAQIGVYLGIVVLVGNTAGVLSSGMLTDFFTRRGYHDAPMRAGMVGCLGTIVPAVLFPFMPGLYSSLLMLGLAMYFANFPPTTSAAAMQVIVPNQMRAQLTALFFVFMNLLGITGGSSLVALSTDYLFRDDMMVGYSMGLTCSFAGTIGAILLYWGLKPFSDTAIALSKVE